MKYTTGDIFDLASADPKLDLVDAICIPVNGYTRTDGSCVMGRGVAEQAAELYPRLPRMVGSKIIAAGNNVHMLTVSVRVRHNKVIKRTIVTFPVKPKKDACTGNNVVAHMKSRYTIGAVVPGWACKAQLSLIRRSCGQLVELTNEQKWTTVVLPKVGCGAGELRWPDVQEVLEAHLDDRFWCVTLPPSISHGLR